MSIMKRGGTLETVNDYITLVKLSNTVAHELLIFKNDWYMQFRLLFLTTYLKPTVTKLEAQLSRGEGFYSHKYSLAIGGPALNDNDFYYIPVSEGSVADDPAQHKHLQKIW